MIPISEQLKLHEDFRSKPYKDTTGHLTIGYGRNLDTKGISKDEAEHMLDNDIKDVVKPLEKYEWYNKLDPIRQKVLIDMGFNLGIPGLLKFKKMIAALKKDDYKKAAGEMANSRWSTQVHSRAYRLIMMMKNGKDYRDPRGENYGR